MLAQAKLTTDVSPKGWLFQVALAFLAAAGLGVPCLGAALSRGLGKQQVAARALLHTQVVDGLQGIQDVLAFGRRQDQLERVVACCALLDRCGMATKSG